MFCFRESRDFPPDITGLSPVKTAREAVKSIATTLTVIALSLGTWVFFYEQNLKLQPSDTVIVVGVWLAVVLFTRWIWARIRNRRGKQTKAAKS